MASSSRGILILPTYNESGNIQPLVEQIHRQGLDLDILVVDDNSSDGTAERVEELARRFPVRLIRREKKMGLGSAHKAGLQYAVEKRYPFILTMDADFAHPPSILRGLLDQVSSSSAEVIVGSRYCAGGDFHRIGRFRPVVSRLSHWLATHLLRLPYDCLGGLRLYRLCALEKIDFRQTPSDGHAFLMEILYALRSAGVRVEELPVVIQPRQEGYSKVSWREFLTGGWTFLRLCLLEFRERLGWLR